MADITEEDLLALTREAREVADAVADAGQRMPPDQAERLRRAADSTFVNLVQALEVFRKDRRQPP